MCSRAACSAAATGCASTSSSSTPKPATISGPSGSTSRWPTCSTCRTRSSRASPISSARSFISAEARRSERAQSPDSFDFLFQGLAWHNKGPTSENLSRARGFFERALALDPGNVDALVMSAMVDFFVAVYLLSEDRAARLAAAEAALSKALSLAPEHALAHYCLGIVLGVTDRAEEGIAECERALAIDRNLAAAHAVIGARKLFLGRAEETEAHVQEALRLSPRDTSAFLWLTFVGAAKIYPRPQRGGGRLAAAIH